MLRRTAGFGTAALLIVALSLAGCFCEVVSWSPDGRFVAFAEHGEGDGDFKLWRWDSRTGKTEDLAIVVPEAWTSSSPVREKVSSCRYLPSRSKILVLTESAEDHENCDYYLMDLETEQSSYVALNALPGFDVSADGESIYYVKEDEKTEEICLWRRKDKWGQKPIFRSKSEFHSPRVDKDEKRALIVVEYGLQLLDLDSSSTRTLIADAKERNCWWPLWLDDETALYLLAEGEGNEGMIGDLVACSVDDATTRLLGRDVHIFYPPSLSPDRKSVVATVGRRNAEGDLDEDWREAYQAASIDLATGELTWLTDAPFGAFSPTLSPDGKRLAYLHMATEGGLLEVLDLETRRRTVAWRDDPERLYATADSLAQGGDAPQALASWEELVKRFPKSELAQCAWRRMMDLYLEPPLADLDKAFNALSNACGDRSRGVVETTAHLFWRESDRVAVDPAEDWITTYGTPQAEKEFGFKTDLARDLRGLWARAGKENIYVRIDYGTNRDLSGLTFQDTVLLFDYDSPETGFRQIGPHTEWDRGAERQVIIRHWFETGEKSQYDMEIRDGKGETISRFLASGFPRAQYPDVQVRYILQEETNSVILALSRQALDLAKAQTVHVQVCTLKGGIEEFKGLERPRGELRDGLPVCDVADAFGSENTRDRIEKEAEQAAAASPGVSDFRHAIRGAAGVFETGQP
ncbi:MAG TPA: hypothetical protein VM492_06890 [Sumerlaeia bacterium]|nr:hypothetical protein [Sumerlaeia bacterium]